VLDLTRGTPQGTVRFYRGIVNIDESGAFEDTTHVVPLLGKVIVDLPFFFESLELAARTGPRTPEVLRNVQQAVSRHASRSPRRCCLPAWTPATASSSRRRSSSPWVRTWAMPPCATRWRKRGRFCVPRRAPYRVVALEPPRFVQHAGRGLCGPSTVKHLLRWSTLLSLYMCFALVVLVALALLGAVPRVRNLLPTLTSARRVGFQQKLLASFLLVALVPALCWARSRWISSSSASWKKTATRRRTRRRARAKRS
jgi:hypothetical protein